MKEKLQDALNEISDEKIAEAAAHKKRKTKIIFRALAAVLVLVVLFNLPNLPMAITAKAVSKASNSRVGQRPAHGTDAYYQWSDARQEAWNNAEAAKENLAPFFKDSAAAYMTGATENRVWSPANAYIALAMLAEITEGNSRQQILDALNTADLDILRTQVSGVWEALYTDDGHEICTQDTTHRLDSTQDYDQETKDHQPNHHKASVYQSDLQSKQASKSLQAWLSNNTGGLLKKYTDAASFPEQAVFTLASTVYLQGKWTDEFSPSNNKNGTFHSPGGDRDVTFMNKKLADMTYYWGDSFGMVKLHLKNGTVMWFILPDEDKTVDDVLAQGEYLDIIVGDRTEDNHKAMKVNLSVPKFDISSSANLTEMFQALGITDVFSMETSDFSALTSDTPVYVTAVNQAARLIIDEEGVKAASYIEMPGAGAAPPPDEIIDFILDRPFLFVLSGHAGIPIFSGVVNEP